MSGARHCRNFSTAPAWSAKNSEPEPMDDIAQDGGKSSVTADHASQLIIHGENRTPARANPGGIRSSRGGTPYHWAFFTKGQRDFARG